MRIVFMIVLFTVHFCFGQQISVTAKNTNGETLSNINVQLIKNKKTLDFKITNSQGISTFTPKEQGNFTLKFTSMQYKTLLMDINTKENTEFVAILQQEIKEIKEVTIKARPKISKAKGDTLSYNIKAIKDGTERTAEDLIKKIPGLDITDNGKVTHNGNMIGQILVEGNEFFGKNHKMATQNLTADMLEGVDLWKNYTTINGNRSTAINLKIKDQYKGKITGNAEVNYGTNNAYLGHANLFKITKTGNLALIADANSIAQNPISFMDFYEMNQQEDIDNRNSITQVEVPSFMNKDDKIQSKNNQFGALQYSKTWKKIQLSAFSLLNFSQLKKWSQSRRKALEGQSTVFDFDETIGENNKGFFGTTQVKFKKSFRDNSFIYYNFGFNPVQDDFLQNTDRIAQNNSFFDIDNKVKNNKLSHFISWTKPLGQSKMVLTFNHLNQFYDENLTIKANEEIFNSNSDQLTQYYEGNNRQTAFNFYFKTNPWLRLTFHSGYKNIGENSRLEEKISHTSENLKVNYHHLLNSINLSKSVGAFNLTAFLSSNYLEHKQEDTHYLEKKFEIRYRLRGKFSSEYSLEYSTTYEQQKHSLLFNHLFYTKELIGNKNGGLQPLSLAKTDNYGFKWHYFNFDRGNLVFLILNYRETTPQFTTNTTNYGTFSEIEYFLNGKKKSWFLLLTNHLNINDAFTLKTKLVGIDNRTENLINQQANQLKIRTLEFSQNLSSSFEKFPIQFDLGYTFNESKFSQSLFDFGSKSQNLKFTLGLRTAIKKEWVASVLGNYIIQKTTNNTLKNFLLGGHFSYQKEQSNFEYHLRFNNILNLKSFQYISNSLSSIGYYESNITALRGYVVGGIKFHF